MNHVLYDVILLPCDEIRMMTTMRGKRRRRVTVRMRIMISKPRRGSHQVKRQSRRVLGRSNL
jgi:hypothetical protein